MATRTPIIAATLAALALAGCAVLPDAAPTDSLIGAWVVQDVAGAGVADGSNLTVEFSETGQVAGSAGCNRYTGAYAFDAAAGTLRVTPLGVTRRLCPPALMTQEARFIEALQSATQVETEADGAVTLSSIASRVLLRRRDPGRRTVAAASAPPPTAAVPAPAQDQSSPNVPAFSSTAPAYQPPADPLAPAAAGAPLALPPPSASQYPLAGASTGAPLYPAPVTPRPVTPAPVQPAPTVAPAPTPVPAIAPAPAIPSATPAALAQRLTASGEITLADAALLPADATLRVQIRDVSRAGAPATVLGEQSFPAAGGPPFPFSVSAPTSVVAPGARLTLVAQLLSGNRLLYMSDTSNPVPVTGAQGMSVRLANAAPVGSRPAAPRVPVVAPPPAPAAAPPPAPPGDTITVYPGDVTGARTYRCRAETFRIRFEDRVAYLATTDGAVARLSRIDVDEDPGAPKIFSNSILTVIKEADASTGERVRFSRGRAGLSTCAPQ